ncbi:MAG: hypothetical protein D6B28_03400 [Gammaproteobacteria bacterium]|nr:MAG: hypothetical protein D6B28_03400 [Gammaproteobacteria bacterium]
MKLREYVTIPHIAIVGTGGRCYKQLQQELEDNGLVVEAVIDQQQFFIEAQANKEIDAYYLDFDETSDKDAEFIDKAYQSVDIPLVFSDQSTWQNFSKWGRRIAIKLFKSINSDLDQKNAELKRQQVAADAQEESAQIKQRLNPATDERQVVWVLGASLGGPEVVKWFLEHLEQTPKACFILAQHIGDGFAELLASQLNRASNMRVVSAETGTRIENGVVITAPVEERLMIHPDGVIALAPEQRESLYKPCIDFVMLEVAERYGQNSGTIIFSGMGDDGSVGCVAIKEYGGTVWAQDADTCAISSMPDCARATGTVSFTGTPEELGQKLIKTLGVLDSPPELPGAVNS